LAKCKQEERTAMNSKCIGREKTSEKKHLAAFVLVPSAVGEKFSTAEF
jgi:hypothetical protein